MSAPEPARRRRLSAALRDGTGVSPLELFFDLVFVLAITQCTALMAVDPSWEQFTRALLVLAVLWWSWVGYAWLTSVVDPEEKLVRVVMFAAMAGLLVASLCVPEVFGDLGLLFAGAYAVVRGAHIALLLIASRDAPGLRRSVIGLAASTSAGVGLLVAASFADGLAQGALWGVAVGLDMAGPYVFGAEGWTLVPEHFTERHGLILIIALGESIVAIGLGAEAGIDAGVVAGAVLGVAVAAALWWLYFDAVAAAAAHHLERQSQGRRRNELARDAYSYLHFPMVAGIVLIALGLKKTLAHVGDPLHTETAAALLGGAALYLLAHVVFRWRTLGSLSAPRLAAALALAALIPVGAMVPALGALGVLGGALIALVVFETVRPGALVPHLENR